MMTPIQSAAAGALAGGLFRMTDGKNLFVTFALVPSLFLLWVF